MQEDMAEEDRDRRAGRMMRRQWDVWRREADVAKADRAKTAQAQEGFRSKCTQFGKSEELFLVEVLARRTLAEDHMVVANGIGKEGKENLTGLTWKEAAESVHRCLNLVLEQMHCQDVLRHNRVQKMRRFLLRACRSQALLYEFDDAVAVAELFIEVRSEEVREEEIRVLMIRGISRFYLGLPSSVKDFADAVILAKHLKHKELEAHAWFAKGYALYFVDPVEYEVDVYECFNQCLEILKAENDTARADSVREVVTAMDKRYAVNWGPRYKERVDRDAEIEKLEAEEKQLREEDGYPGDLACVKQALGYWLFHKNIFFEAEQKFRESVILWAKANRMKKDSMYQVTAGLSITTAYNQLQACLVQQGKPLEALMWAERARAKVLRKRLEHEDAEFDLFEENDNFAQEKLQTALDGCSGSVVAVEYSFVSTDLLIWVLKPKSLPIVKQVALGTVCFPQIEGVEVQKTSLTIMELVDVLLQRMKVTANSDRRSKEYLEFFHKLLIEPIKEELRGFDTIIFIPVQALNRLPWAAIRDRDGQYLCQQYAVVCAPSLYVLGFCSQQWEKRRTTKCSHGDEILLVSNPWPLSLPNYTRLKFAETETNEIRKLLKTYTGLVPTEYRRRKATRATVIEKLQEAKWLHIASHNILDNYYNAGALMLSAPSAQAYDWDKSADVIDIQLGSGKILSTRTNYGPILGHNMDDVASREETKRGLLSAMQLSNIPTQACGVVLSACSTGKGELIGDEGLLGLVRALLMAGTPAVMVSLWDISDEHTSTLMKHLYKNLLEGDPETGLPCMNWALALKRAMESMIGSSPEVQVGHWAAFQINGTPDVTFPVSKTSNGYRLEIGWSRRKTHIIVASLVFAAMVVLWATIFRCSGKLKSVGFSSWMEFISCHHQMEKHGRNYCIASSLNTPACK